MNNRVVCLLLITTSLVVVSPRASAAAVTLRPVADTGLFENRANNNLGSMTFVPLGTILNGPERNRALFRFDVAGNVPAGAQITSASLRITVTFAPAVSSPVMDVHRMLTSWMEGNNTGGPGGGNVGSAANAGEPSWNNRAAPSTPWGAGGGLAGTDFVSGASASQPVSFNGASTFSSPALATDVQAWLDNPGSNFGWILKTQNEATRGTARRVATREGGAANAPQLTVEFQVAPRIERVAVSVDPLQFQFQFQALTGTSYEVQRRPQLGPGTWTTFTNIGPQNLDADIVILDTIDSDGQFYQVIIP